MKKKNIKNLGKICLAQHLTCVGSVSGFSWRLDPDPFFLWGWIQIWIFLKSIRIRRHALIYPDDISIIVTFFILNTFIWSKLGWIRILFFLDCRIRYFFFKVGSGSPPPGSATLFETEFVLDMAAIWLISSYDHFVLVLLMKARWITAFFPSVFPLPPSLTPTRQTTSPLKIAIFSFQAVILLFNKLQNKLKTCIFINVKEYHSQIHKELECVLPQSCNSFKLR